MKQKIQIIIFVLTLTTIGVYAIKQATVREDRIMSVNYCFDSEQNHYVAPDERCKN